MRSSGPETTVLLKPEHSTLMGEFRKMLSTCNTLEDFNRGYVSEVRDVLARFASGSNPVTKSTVSSREFSTHSTEAGSIPLQLSSVRDPDVQKCSGRPRSTRRFTSVGKPNKKKRKN